MPSERRQGSSCRPSERANAAACLRRWTSSFARCVFTVSVVSYWGPRDLLIRRIESHERQNPTYALGHRIRGVVHGFRGGLLHIVRDLTRRAEGAIVVDAFTADVQVIFLSLTTASRRTSTKCCLSSPRARQARAPRRFIGVWREPAIYQTLSSKPKH